MGLNRKKTLLFVFGAFLCLAAAEIAIRAGAWTYVQVQKNRNRESALSKGEYRILCIGESTTMNQYPRPLEEELNRRGGGVRFKVIDRGVIGVSSDGIVAALEHNLDEYKPDMVAAMLGENDYGPFVSFGETGRFAALRGFLNKSSVYKAVVFMLRLKRAEDAAPVSFLSGKSFLLAALFAFESESAAKQVQTRREEDELFSRAMELQERGEYADARKLYERVIGLRGKQASSAFIELSRMKSNALDFEGAAAIVDRGLRQAPSPLLYAEAGKIADRRDDYAKALKLLFKALTENKTEYGEDAARILDELGHVYRHTGDADTSERYFRAALKAEPRNWYRYYALADALGMYKKKEQARAVLKQGLDVLGPVPQLKAALASFEDKQPPDISNSGRGELYNPKTAINYRRIRDMVLGRKLRLVCSQYPLRPVAPLVKMLGEGGIIYVDNGPSFKKAVAAEGYDAYFIDRFGGDFGHCTEKGNRLLARNIADAILSVF